MRASWWEWCPHFRADLWVVGNKELEMGRRCFGSDHWLNASEVRWKVCWEGEGVREKDRDRRCDPWPRPSTPASGPALLGTGLPRDRATLVQNSRMSQPIENDTI